MQEMQETQVLSLHWEDPLEKKMSTHPELLPEKSLGQRSLADCSPWGLKESDMTEHTLMSSPYPPKLQCHQVPQNRGGPVLGYLCYQVQARNAHCSTDQ